MAIKREIFKTADGSSSIRLPDWGEQYHSKYGAIQESKHVFIKNGLAHVLENRAELKSISILEMGFGTGLNVLLTACFLADKAVDCHYTSVEAFPLNPDEWDQLNYPSQLNADNGFFEKLHTTPWGQSVSVTKNFRLNKIKASFETIREIEAFDLVFFDAFGPQVQPELWAEPIFKAMFDALRAQGILVTYSAKGSVRRTMEAVGFRVERIPGPPGKREMMRASKPF